MPVLKSGSRATPSKKPAAKASPKAPLPRRAAPVLVRRMAKPPLKAVPVVAAQGAVSMVQQAVEALRRRILASPGEEAFLGSEEQLIEALGVSRPTFRQAARLLEHEMLLKIKRGIGGGFFAQPPSARAVSRMAAIYLQARSATQPQIAAAFGPAMEEAAGLLAASGDASARRRLADYVQLHAGFDKSPDEAHRLRVARGFDTLLGDLCGNPAVALMVSLLRDLVPDAGGAVGLSPERARLHAGFHRQLAEAVQRRDPDMARLLTRRYLKK